MKKKSFKLKAGDKEATVFENSSLSFEDGSCVEFSTPREMGYLVVDINSVEEIERFSIDENEISWSCLSGKWNGFGFSKSEMEILNLDLIQKNKISEKKLQLKIAYKRNLKKI